MTSIVYTFAKSTRGIHPWHSWAAAAAREPLSKSILWVETPAGFRDYARNDAFAVAVTLREVAGSRPGAIEMALSYCVAVTLRAVAGSRPGGQ